jgi:hypothetical protein
MADYKPLAAYLPCIRRMQSEGEEGKNEHLDRDRGCNSMSVKQREKVKISNKTAFSEV